VKGAPLRYGAKTSDSDARVLPLSITNSKENENISDSKIHYINM
jgi:hypothetical protein